ncbi:hypothetical protein ACFSHR_23375 [Azotobacter chroococcum]
MRRPGSPAGCAGAPPMPGWSSAQLRVLGWLALATVLGTLVIVLLSFSGLTRVRGVAAYANWLGLILVLLGNYLLLRLKSFAEARFAARGLGWPVWLSVALGLLLEAAALLFESAPLAAWQAWLYAAALIGYGGLLVWLGVRLLAAPGPSRPCAAWAGWRSPADSCWPPGARGAGRAAPAGCPSGAGAGVLQGASELYGRP